MSKVFVGLVHYPIYNKNKEIINTSVTNLDIHDIARSAATYNLERYYLIQPSEAQHDLIRDILNYWQRGFGAQYNPDRKQAVDMIVLKKSIVAVQCEITSSFAGPLYTIGTDAGTYSNNISYRRLREDIISSANANYLLLFGTGWGMTEQVMENCDYILEPVYGAGCYNHLSVRSAAAIILDRLLGDNWWK